VIIWENKKQMDTMQKIPLRLFYRKIEELIINQQSDAAISHAKYLLEKYPKNLAVYKLLGKAFLEKQEFDFANTIFEKILRVEPDDFVSHIGISIIAESFGNLEKSLKSMRRAYELEPSNESLQIEVKRLQETKNGFALDQVRLTRGALIKMYSRSQLTEQAIAEARLGIQESPDRIDYKVHLANMLFSSGRKIKAIEVCIDIISTLPYCKPALIILNKSIAPLDKTSESTVYKIRLAEIDPYFSFITPDTNSVEDIPDIAIMVEEREKPITPIGNFNNFIKEAWKQTTQYDDLLSSKDQIKDWPSIIDDAVSNNGIGVPISDTSYEEVIVPSDEGKVILETYQQEPPPLITKKDRLRRKLSATQKDTHDKKIIPEWVFDNSLSSKNKEDNKDFSKIPIVPNKSLFNELEEQPKPDDSFAHTFDLDGMTDHDSPINSSIDSSNLKQVSPTWVSQHSDGKTENAQEVIISLDDTQKINVLPEDPEELVALAFNSIDGKKIKFAYQCFYKLIRNNYKLKELAIQLEDICRQYPAEVDLWLILVEVYKKLGLKEKSLETLEKAQNNLSF
jgi:tetratricopeptide (TPR) repeat protein